MDDTGDDPVVKEVDVHLSQSLASRLFLFQYPLRPSHSPYLAENVLSAEVCDNGEGVKLDMKVRPRGENYSTSRGSYYARMVNLGAGGGEVGSGGYDSELWDRVMLTSTSIPPKGAGATCHYAAAVFKDGSLHLTPLQGVLQLRPSLTYLDKADVGVHKTEAAANATTNSGGETTESEGEDAKLVTVKFSKPDGVGRSQKKVGHKMTFTEVKENLRSSQTWSRANFFGMDSEEADEERRLLIASEDDQHGTFDLLEEQYLDLIFPRELGRREEMEAGNGAPSGVVSLERIKKFPLKRQVLEVLRTAHIIHFKQLCSMLGVSGGQMGAVLEALVSCAVLVQGCWVVASTILYPDAAQVARRNARDYILHCFNQRRLVPRKEIMGVVRLPNEDVRQLMQSLAILRFAPQQAWEFKLESDVEFISRNGSVMVKEEEKWSRRYRELVMEVNLKSPASTKPPVESSLGTGAGARGNVGKEQQDSRPRQRKRSDSFKGEREESTNANISSAERIQSSLSHTSQHSSAALNLKPQTITETDIKKEIKREMKEEAEEDGEADMAFVVDVCREAMGRGAVSIGEVKDRLLLRQLEADSGNMVREGHVAVPRGGVSEALLEHGLQLCGAVEVGKPSGKRLFALPLDNKCRSVVLELFQKHQKLRKSQVVELMADRGNSVLDKTVVKTLKELCYGKGGHWRLMGT